MSHRKRKDWVLMQRTQKHKHARTGQTVSNEWLIVPSSLCSVVCVAMVIGILLLSFRRKQFESLPAVTAAVKNDGTGTSLVKDADAGGEEGYPRSRASDRVLKLSDNISLTILRLDSLSQCCRALPPGLVRDHRGDRLCQCLCAQVGVNFGIP